MSRLDPHLGSNAPEPHAPLTRHIAGEGVGLRVGEAVPIGKKRIMYRFWLAAIAVGLMIWAAIAYGLGLI